MTDVTAAMRDRGVTTDMSDAAAEALREKNRDLILASARGSSPELEPQVVKLFQGGIWQLYQYRVFDDIRLVMAPHLQAAHFGGDPDNFVYPRYAVDFAFCRAYVDGKPADTSDHYFSWGDGPEVGELVILTGNPGGTSRLLTKSQLEYQRDARYPRVRELIDNRIEILREFGKRDPRMEKALRTTILSLENGQKLYRGEHGALTSGFVHGAQGPGRSGVQEARGAARPRRRSRDLGRTRIPDGRRRSRSRRRAASSLPAACR